MLQFKYFVLLKASERCAPKLRRIESVLECGVNQPHLYRCAIQRDKEGVLGAMYKGQQVP